MGPVLYSLSSPHNLLQDFHCYFLMPVSRTYFQLQDFHCQFLMPVSRTTPRCPLSSACARNGRRDPRPPLSQEVPGQEKFYLCWNSISQLACYAPVPTHSGLPGGQCSSFHFGQRRERGEREIHRRNTLQIEEIQGVSLYFSCHLHPRWCSSRSRASRPSSLIRRWALSFSNAETGQCHNRCH